MTLNLVTGGGGFLGAFVVDVLRARGEAVRVLDLSPSARDEVEWIQGSVTDRDCVARAVEGVDAVFHLAANANLWARDPLAFEKTNHQGTRVVLDAAQAAGVKRLVYVSSAVTLVGRDLKRGLKRDLGRDLVDIDETVRLGVDEMLGPYCRSKWLAQDAALGANAEGFSVCAVLPTTPIGPGDFRETPPTKMIAGYVNGKTPAYLECSLNFIDVRDCADAIVAARDAGRPGERYLLGGENLQMSVFLDVLSRVSGVKTPRATAPYPVAWAAAAAETFLSDWFTRRPPTAPLTGVRLAGRGVRFNSAKARAALGLTVRPVEESLRDAIDWMRAEGLVSPAAGR